MQQFHYFLNLPEFPSHSLVCGIYQKSDSDSSITISGNYQRFPTCLSLNLFLPYFYLGSLQLPMDPVASPVNVSCSTPLQVPHLHL